MNNESEAHSDFVKLTQSFINEGDEHKAFGMMDDLCNMIIQSPDDVLKEAELHNFDSSALKKSIAKIDALSEQNSAKAILNSENKHDSFVGYEWELRDYYESEYTFISDNLQSSPQTIAYIGHGSLSVLSNILYDNITNLHIDFYDIDPVTTKIAKSILEKYRPNANSCFRTANILDTDLDGNYYDLAIVTNAPLLAFINRDKPLPARNIFLRSATRAGGLLYPRIDVSSDISPHYSLVTTKDDPVYKIHQMHILETLDAK